jgi:metal-sulfur cluster biosynthetic enzyme
MICESDVRAELNQIIDPCSRAAGLPAGLEEMGLVRAVKLRDTAAGTDVSVVIGVTEYGCLMGAPFANEAYKRLKALPGLGVLEVRLDTDFDWDVADMRRDYQERLKLHRARRGLLKIPVAIVQGAPPSNCAADGKPDPLPI